MYDAAGNMIKDASHQYAYDAEGNLLSVDNGATASYVYNALNQRLQINVPREGTSMREVTHGTDIRPRIRQPITNGVHMNHLDRVKVQTYPYPDTTGSFLCSI